jgi:hypothetical protein
MFRLSISAKSCQLFQSMLILLPRGHHCTLPRPILSVPKSSSPARTCTSSVFPLFNLVSSMEYGSKAVTRVWMILRFLAMAEFSVSRNQAPAACLDHFTSLGNSSPAGPRSETWTSLETGVSSILTSITFAPDARAMLMRLAAGYTTPEVPTTRSTSASRAACSASSHIPSGSDSPNQTTPGRAMPPHRQCGGSLGSGTLRSGQSDRHSKQRNRQMSPCNLRIRPLPARSCRPSTFCVTKVK